MTRESTMYNVQYSEYATACADMALCTEGCQLKVAKCSYAVRKI